MVVIAIMGNGFTGLSVMQLRVETCVFCSTFQSCENSLVQVVSVFEVFPNLPAKDREGRPEVFCSRYRLRKLFLLSRAGGEIGRLQGLEDVLLLLQKRQHSPHWHACFSG